MFKLDFFKAFDRVSSFFLDNILGNFSFGSKWHAWLNTCWRTASFSLLINGLAGILFKRSRGLRQGNPLSPMTSSGGTHSDLSQSSRIVSHQWFQS